MGESPQLSLAGPEARLTPCASCPSAEVGGSRGLGPVRTHAGPLGTVVAFREGPTTAVLQPGQFQTGSSEPSEPQAAGLRQEGALGFQQILQSDVGRGVYVETKGILQNLDNPSANYSV